MSSKRQLISFSILFFILLFFVTGTVFGERVAVKITKTTHSYHDKDGNNLSDSDDWDEHKDDPENHPDYDHTDDHTDIITT